MIERLRALGVEWQAAASGDNEGYALSVLYRLSALVPSAQELAASGVGRVVTRASLGACAAPSSLAKVEALRARWKSSLDDVPALKALCAELVPHVALLGGVEFLDIAFVLLRDGFTSLFMLDEADPAIFAEQPAPVRGALTGLIEAVTREGRDTCLMPVRGVPLVCPLSFPFWLSCCLCRPPRNAAQLARWWPRCSRRPSR